MPQLPCRQQPKLKARALSFEAVQGVGGQHDAGVAELVSDDLQFGAYAQLCPTGPRPGPRCPCACLRSHHPAVSGSDYPAADGSGYHGVVPDYLAVQCGHSSRDTDTATHTSDRQSSFSGKVDG
jgi:hypothetical protein